jgi:hypothetical protein
VDALHRLANVAACPHGAKTVPWLIKRGFLVEKPDRYDLTTKGMRLNGRNGVVSLRKKSYPVAAQ